MAVGMSYVMANGDVDLSVGAVLALSGSTAAFLMKFMGWAPLAAGLAGFAAGLARRLRQRAAGDPAAAAGVRRHARHVLHRARPRRLAGGRPAAQPVPRELQPDRPQADRDPAVLGHRAGAGRPRGSTSPARSRPRASFWACWPSSPASCWPRRRIGYRVMATGGNRRAAEYAGIDTDRVRFWSLVFCAACASLAGLIYIAYYRSFNPPAGQLRELDVIAAVIIGGASIFGGYGSILGALAGAAVITLLRGAAVPADHPARRQLADHAAALGQRVHRPDPDRRRAGRHLAAPGGAAGAAGPAPARGRKEQTRHERHAPGRDARHPEELRRGPGAGRRRACGCSPARSWAWSATTRPASRR